MHQQECTDAYQPYHRRYESRDDDVCRHRAEPRLPPATNEATWQPVSNDEQISRAHTEHDNRVPVNAVSQSAPSRQREILVHGQCIDVPDTATIEIARSRVVNSVSAPPEVVRC